VQGEEVDGGTYGVVADLETDVLERRRRIVSRRGGVRSDGSSEAVRSTSVSDDRTPVVTVEDELLNRGGRGGAAVEDLEGRLVVGGVEDVGRGEEGGTCGKCVLLRKGLHRKTGRRETYRWPLRRNRRRRPRAC
jgi:hypothetical protein